MGKIQLTDNGKYDIFKKINIMDLTFQYKSVCSSEGYEKSSELVTNSAATNKWYEILNVF